MKDFRSLEHKIRDIVSETVGRNTEQRMKVKNVGRPEDTDRSKLAKQGEIKTKIIDEASFKRGDKVSYETSKNNKNNKGVVHSVKGDKVTVKGSNYLGGEVLHDVHHSMVRKEETAIDEATKKKVKEDDQTTDPIARINAVTSNLKQMTNEPKPAPSLPNVNDIPSDNPASKMFKIKEAASDSFDKSDDKKKESKEPKKDFKKDDGDDPKKITGGKTEVDLQPTTNDSPEMNDTEDKSSNKAKNKANKEIGAKGVKEQVMTEKNFGLPESLIQAVNEVLKGKQKKLDKNHNGKLDGEDFKMLRKEEVVDEGNADNKAKKNAAVSAVGAKNRDDHYLDRMNPTVADKIRGREKMSGKDRQWDEEVEQVDELSPDTMHRYQDRAADSIAHSKRSLKRKEGDRVAHAQEIKKRYKGLDLSNERLAKKEMDEEVEQVDEKVKTTHENPLVTVHDKHGLHTHANLSTANKIFNTKVKHTDVHAGPVKTKDGHETKNDLKFAISKHHASAMKEEVEQVDEVSKKTLSNYIRKASSDAANHAYTAGMGDKGDAINKDANHQKATSRLKGISKASQKLAKEEVEFSDAELAHIETIINSINGVK